MKRILIDTHILIWHLTANKKLNSKYIDLIADSNNIVYLSSASIFEFYIKISIGKIEEIPDLENVIKEFDFNIIQADFKHYEVLKSLPFLHKDPFDRLIIATAIAENLEVVSYDNRFKLYEQLNLI